MTNSPAFEAGCAVCNKLRAQDAAVLFENELWHVRAADDPCGVPGWMMLITRRHVPGPASFDDREASSFGPTLRHLQRVLLEVTDALRIYTAAMGESSPQFHAHMVPRYAVMPKGAKACIIETSIDPNPAAKPDSVSWDQIKQGACFFSCDGATNGAFEPLAGEASNLRTGSYCIRKFLDAGYRLVNCFEPRSVIKPNETFLFQCIFTAP